ncbi:MAG: hypothetical protein [Olavius algarvensis Gamma 3 endosymbiont]|nr:MAG: hypothetical protein [Olavius algarvensis Gamma 3 endosymbiont]
MEFSCTLESADQDIKLAKVILRFAHAGFLIVTQKQEPSGGGNSLFYVTARTKTPQSQKDVKTALEQIEGCKLVNLEFGDSQDDLAANNEGEILKKIAANYPDIDGVIKTFAVSLDEESRDSAISAIGAKVGASIYARDYSLGSPLPMPATLHRELVPTLKVFSEIEASDSSVKLLKCPFCAKQDGEPAACGFITGLIKGFMDRNPAIENSNVEESSCGSGGDNACTFSIR